MLVNVYLFLDISSSPSFFESFVNESKIQVFEECNVLDVDCESRCVCEEGLKGISCEYKSDEFDLMLKSKHLLMETLNNISHLQEVNVGNVKSWLMSLSSLSIDSSSLGGDTKRLMGELCEKCLRYGSELGMSYEEMSNVGEVLDLILDSSTSSSDR